MPGRIIAKIRIYHTSSRKWKHHRIVTTDDLDKHGKLTIELARGGSLRYASNFVSDIDCQSIMHEITSQGLNYFRTYGRTSTYHEPRIHFLLSQQRPTNLNGSGEATDSAKPAATSHELRNVAETNRSQNIHDLSDGDFQYPGYQYHDRIMRSYPMDTFPSIHKLAGILGNEEKLENRVWNSGIDVILYRSKQDSIDWHSDTSQSESLILTAIVQSPNNARPVQVRSKGTLRYDNDEFIELFPAKGDIYAMDGTLYYSFSVLLSFSNGIAIIRLFAFFAGHMQLHYEHCVPKLQPTTALLTTAADDCRCVLVFRQGIPKFVNTDTGEPVDTLHPPDRSRIFGSIKGLEEGKFYSQSELIEKRAHL